MDISLFMRVIARFKALTAVGVVFAFVLAFLSMATVDFKNGVQVHFRSKQQWVSRGTVLVTERRFPLGRSVLDDATPLSTTGASTSSSAQPFAPSERFTELANIYAELATSDAVRQFILREGPIVGKIEASALATLTQQPLPLVSVDGIAPTQTGAVALAQRASDALRRYIELKQQGNGIPVEQRVVLTQIKEPRLATVQLLKGRSKTLPIVVFLVVLFGVIGLALVLENLRPRIRPVAAEAAAGSSAAENALARRSA
jgi:hypothetical protein